MDYLDSFLAPDGGYYRVGEEDAFPWDCTNKIVWYSLLIVEDGTLKKYGFTPSKSQKQCLLEVLQNLPVPNNAELLGVWTGSYSTHLFCLDINKAIEKLKAVV